jgi:ufm1-conjugating enzyme 1
MESLVDQLPAIVTVAGPRDPGWSDRLREEYIALITYVELCKEQDNEWFNIEPDETGINWSGKCWYIHELVRHEFILNFEIPATYP